MAILVDAWNLLHSPSNQNVLVKHLNSYRATNNKNRTGILLFSKWCHIMSFAFRVYLQWSKTSYVWKSEWMKIVIVPKTIWTGSHSWYRCLIMTVYIFSIVHRKFYAYAFDFFFFAQKLYSKNSRQNKWSQRHWILFIQLMTIPSILRSQNRYYICFYSQT